MISQEYFKLAYGARSEPLSEEEKEALLSELIVSTSHRGLWGCISCVHDVSNNCAKTSLGFISIGFSSGFYGAGTTSGGPDASCTTTDGLAWHGDNAHCPRQGSRFAVLDGAVGVFSERYEFDFI